eukprot:5764841-Pyramimonas_sp.AAC.3
MAWAAPVNNANLSDSRCSTSGSAAFRLAASAQCLQRGAPHWHDSRRLEKCSPAWSCLNAPREAAKVEGAKTSAWRHSLSRFLFSLFCAAAAFINSDRLPYSATASGVSSANSRSMRSLVSWGRGRAKRPYPAWATSPRVPCPSTPPLPPAVWGCWGRERAGSVHRWAKPSSPPFPSPSPGERDSRARRARCNLRGNQG